MIYKTNTGQIINTERQEKKREMRRLGITGKRYRALRRGKK